MSLQTYVQGPTSPATPVSVANEYLDTQVPTPSDIVVVSTNPAPVMSAAAAYRELERADQEDFQASAQRSLEGLVGVRHALERANRRGGLSAESAYFAALSVQSYGTPIGIGSDSMSQAFESVVSGDGKTVVSLEELDHALEGADSLLADMGRRALGTLARAATPVWVAVKGHSIVAGSFIKKARAMPAAGRAEKITVPAFMVQMGNAKATDVVGEYKRLANDLVYLVNQFSKDAEEAFEQNTNALSVLGTKDDGPEHAVSRMSELLRRWKDPRDKLKNGTDAKPYIGNVSIFRDQKLKYHGQNADAKKFDAIANLKYPVGAGGAVMDGYGTMSKGEKISIDAWSAKDIIEIGEILQKAAKQFGLWEAIMETAAASFSIGHAVVPYFGFIKLGKAWMGLAWLIKAAKRGTHFRLSDVKKNAKRDTSNDLATVVDAFKTSSRLRFHVSYDAGMVLLHALANFQNIAKASLKAHGKAALEAYDNHTAVDGESVNETAPNEPTQAPAKDNQAPEGEVTAEKPSINNDPRTEQDLNGTAADTNRAPVTQRVNVAEAEPGKDELSKATESVASVKVVTAGPGRPYWLKP